MYDQAPSYRGPTDILAPDTWPVIQLQQSVPETVTITICGDSKLDSIAGTGSSGESTGSSPECGSAPSCGSNPWYGSLPGNGSAPCLPNRGGGVTIVIPGGEEVTDCIMAIKDHADSTQVHVVQGVRISQNQFQFSFARTDLLCPGLFLGDVMLLDTPGNYMTPIYVYRLYIEVEQNASDSVYLNRPLTIAEIRLAMRDQDAAENLLLDDIEASNREIHWAIQHVVDSWNELLPPVATFNYSNFPFRAHWIEGAIGHLLRIVARSKLRNHLPYSAGGVTIDDTSRWKEYESLGNSMVQKFEDWAQRKKVSINIDGAYGWIN